MIKFKILNKKTFKVSHIFFYKYQVSWDVSKLIKYYFYTLPIRYAFSIIYTLLEIIKDNKYTTLMKVLLTRVVNIAFIYIFGFPVLVLEVSNKLYTRIYNSTDGYRVDWDILKLNLNSMFFFDFKETLYIEDLEIYFNAYNLNSFVTFFKKSI